MRKDEFNELKIVNEDENLNFEFGETQESESTSYKDNSDRLRDEINDNKIFNETKSLNKNKKKQRKNKKSEKDGSSSNGSSLATSITTIVGASLISVTTLATLIGINIFFNGKCKMNALESSPNAIAYDLDLNDIKNDKCIIKIENNSYSDSQALVEGQNAGEFVDLIPSTEYHVSVVDVSYNNFVLYEDKISTKDEDVPPLESCIITFDANGGDGEQKEDIGYVGQEYILPECTFTAPNGYAFDCWQLSGTEDNYNPGEGYLVESQDTITFIAIWGEAATLEFYPGIGAQGNVTSIKYVIGKEYTIPNGEEYFIAPTNQEFDYWFDDMYSEQRHAGDVITIEDTYYSFTGHWKYLDGLTFTVTFETNGGSEIEPQVVQAGTNATKPDDPTKDEYIFQGWYSNSELTNSYNFITPVTGDITLYAKWEELPKVTISFEANGGTGEMETDYQYLGKEYILPECTFTAPNGYAFDCWQLSGTEDNYNPGEGYLVESQDTITFIALWAEAATVEFYPGIGATGSVTSIKVAIGKEYTIPNGEDFFIAPENQEFDYWFDDMYSEQRHAGDIITVEDTYYSFTAHWKYLDGLTFTVTFDSNGGSEVESQVVQAGTNATKPDDPTKDDYIFEGWYSNSELTNSYNFITPVTEDITLYAKWSTTYSVSGEEFNGFPNSTVDYATESEINGVNLQVSAYSCYFNDPDDGHGLWIPLGYNSQSPEDYISYLANKTPINGSIKNIAITVGPSAYDGTSITTLHVTFGTEPMLEHLTSGTTITYDTDATLVVECNLDGFSYFNITNVSENGLVIESIVVTYYVN